ncbi:Gamma-tubulin complex component 4 [Cymbomonas tetramitiformis]|uniref:Gamma-tubulin complex component n=1 Tax=Cymbomonas tetramitiformis TaxID=36881 RepID=A0AAE0BBL2_9CHLO|nr:Gamma-tubulin complex component 4 [Cymbomonas tetramitiformis]
MRPAATSLARLQAAQEYHRLSFEHAVEDIRSMVAKHLWQLVVVQGSLVQHLQALKDYFLMNKGDFFQTFLEEAKGLCKMPPRTGGSSENDLRVHFQQASLRSTAADDPMFSNIKLRLDVLRAGEECDANADAVLAKLKLPHYDGWGGMSLDYVVVWPLGLLLTEAVLRRYNHIFQYLSRLKRVQLELDNAWDLLRQRAHSRCPSSMAVRPSPYAGAHPAPLSGARPPCRFPRLPWVLLGMLCGVRTTPTIASGPPRRVVRQKEVDSHDCLGSSSACCAL